MHDRWRYSPSGAIVCTELKFQVPKAWLVERVRARIGRLREDARAAEAAEAAGASPVIGLALSEEFTPRKRRKWIFALSNVLYFLEQSVDDVVPLDVNEHFTEDRLIFGDLVLRFPTRELLRRLRARRAAQRAEAREEAARCAVDRSPNGLEVLDGGGQPPPEGRLPEITPWDQEPATIDWLIALCEVAVDEYVLLDKSEFFLFWGRAPGYEEDPPSTERP